MSAIVGFVKKIQDPPRVVTREKIGGIKYPPMSQKDAEQEVSHVERTL